MRVPHSKLYHWLRLLRAPNLLTVPGDPLAGFLLSSGGLLAWNALWPVGAALCFYAAGLLLNDFADVNEDLCARPERPLPSGAVNPMSALGLGIILLLLGVAFSGLGGKGAFCMGALLGALVVSYNFWSKQRPFFGALNMGLCRAGSLSLGAAFGSGMGFVSASLLLLVYIGAVTFLARYETSAQRVNKSLPASVLLIMSPLFLAGSGAWVSSAAMMMAALVAAGSVAWGSRRVTPADIGVLIGCLLPIQAAFCASTGKPGLIVGLLLLALWPVSRIVGRRFYAS